jgi:galactose mutarotase-like enzyme
MGVEFMSLISIKNQFLTVVIDSLGAELASIKDPAGTEYLWQGDARFWKSRAPVLFPIVGGVKDDQYTLDGQTYTLPKHGFAKFQEFIPEIISDVQVVMTLTSNPELRSSYPFDFVLQLGYKLEGNSLLVDYVIKNQSSRIMYASIGAHEGYACPEGIEAYQLAFEQTEVLATTQLDGNLLNGKTKPVVTDGNILPLKYEWFAVDALVFTALKSQAVTLTNQSGSRKLRVEFPGFPSLGIWTKPGAPYICIEPWCGLPDFTDRNGDITKKRGILSIAPDQQLTRTHKIIIG